MLILKLPQLSIEKDEFTWGKNSLTRTHEIGDAIIVEQVVLYHIVLWPVNAVLDQKKVTELVPYMFGHAARIKNKIRLMHLVLFLIIL